MVHCSWIQMNPLHFPEVQSRAVNTTANSKYFKEPNLFFTVAWKLKTSHQHTRTRGSTLKSRCTNFSQRFFHPTFNRTQFVLHCITIQQEQNASVGTKRVREQESTIYGSRNKYNISSQSAFLKKNFIGTFKYPLKGTFKETFLCFA